MQPYVLRLFVAVIIFLATPVVAVDYSDNFQDDTPPNPPSDSWYNFASTGAGSARVSSAQPSISTNTLLVDDTSAGTAILATFDMSTVGVDVCESGGFGASLKFAIYFVDFGGAGQSSIGFVSDNGIDIGFIRFSSAGAVSLIAGGSAGSGFATLSLATWYNITLNVLDTTGTTCANTDTIFATGYVTELDASGQLSGTVGGAFATNVGETLRITNDNIANVATYYLDNLQVNNVNEPPPTAVGALTTVAVTNLVGFDVDPTGAGLIARVDGGDDIKSFTPNTLTEIGTREVDCNGIGNQNNDMVASSDFANLYVVCDSVTNNPAFLSIRSYNEAAPTFGDSCSTDCLDDIDLRSGSECASGSDDFPDDLDLRELNDVQSVPLDYSKTYGGTRVFAVAFAYSADNGNVGVLQYSARPSLDDRCRTSSRAFSGTTPEQISVWQPDPESENVYIAAVDSGGASRFYVYTPGETGAPTRFEGSISTGSPLGDTTGGVAVSCDDDYCLVVTNGATDNVRLINVKTGVTSWRKTATSEVNRGAALAIRGDLTGGNDFAVWVDGSTVNLAYAGNGTVFGSLTMPSGTFKEVRLKDGSSNAWIATSSVIAYYDLISAFPSIIPTGCENPPCDVFPTVTQDGLFSGTGAQVGSGLGIGTFGGNIFAGTLLIGLMAVPTYAATKSRVLAGFAVIGGFMLAWGFGFFGAGVVFSVVVLVAALLWFTRGSGQSG